MTITPLPTPPSRNDPEATFVSRANDFLGALPTFGTQANALAAAVNADKVATQTAAAIAPVTLAAANFKGNWSDLTGAVSVPASVFHSNKFWTLAEDLADVTAKEPGVDAEWIELETSGFDYQEFTTSGTWIKPSGALLSFVECIGGGRGGNAVTSTGVTATQQSQGGDNNLRSISRAIFSAADAPSTLPVVIGAGGAGAERTSSTAGIDNGSNGGQTIFGGGDTNIVSGGGGASNITASSDPEIFRGGRGQGINSSGNAEGNTDSLFAGSGGAAVIAFDANATGENGQAPGGAGGAALARNVTTARTAKGGDGAPGRCRVWTLIGG